LGDALGIGNGIIRWAGSLGNAVQVAAADAVTALGVGAAVGDAAVANGTADCLLVDALFPRRFMDVDLGVQMSSCCGDQLPQEGQPSGSRLFGAVLAERIGFALRFVNEGNEPGRSALGQIEIDAPRFGQSYFWSAARVRARVSAVGL